MLGGGNNVDYLHNIITSVTSDSCTALMMSNKELRQTRCIYYMTRCKLFFQAGNLKSGIVLIV